MRRPLLYGLCGAALATGLGTVIALAGDYSDANPATAPSVGTDGHHQVFLVRLPQGQDGMDVMPLDGPRLPEGPSTPDAPTPSAAAPGALAPRAPTPSAPTPSTPSASEAKAASKTESTGSASPATESAAEPKRRRIGSFSPWKKAAPDASTAPASPPASSRFASPPPAPDPDPPVSLGMPAMDRIVEKAKDPFPTSPTNPASPSAQAPEAAPAKPTPDTPRVLLKRARELYAQNKLREAEALARHINTMLVKWVPEEDTPAKLLSDIQLARQAAVKESTKESTPAQPRFPRIAAAAAKLNLLGDSAPAAQATVQANGPASPVLPAPTAVATATPASLPPAVLPPAVLPPAATQSAVLPPATTPPVTTLPVATPPRTTSPAARQPVAAQPVAAVTAVTQPVATLTAVTQPVATQPAAAQPATVPTTTTTRRSPIVQTSALEPQLELVPAEAPSGTAFASQPAVVPPIVAPPVVASAPPAPTPTAAPKPATTPTITPPATDSLSHANDPPVIESCEHWEGHPMYVAGDFGMGIVRPYIKNNPAFFVSTSTNPAAARQMEFNPATQFLPELSLALVGADDWGFRVNWWGFATSDVEGVSGVGRTVTAAPLGLGFVSTNPADSFTAFSKLSMDVTDFEAMHDFHGCNWAIEVAGGFRYAHIGQRYDVVAIGPLTDPLVLSGQSFNGFGPTLFARGRWQVAGTGFYGYGAGRGSLLYGKAEQDAWLSLPTGIVNAATNSRMIMPVAEMELGVGYRRVWRGTDLFFEVGLDYQTWFEAGSSSRSTIEPNPPFVVPGGNSATVDYNLGLMALTFRVGMNY